MHCLEGLWWAILWAARGNVQCFLQVTHYIYILIEVSLWSMLLPFTSISPGYKAQKVFLIELSQASSFNLNTSISDGCRKNMTIKYISGKLHTFTKFNIILSFKHVESNHDRHNQKEIFNRSLQKFKNSYLGDTGNPTYFSNISQPSCI